MTKFLNKLFLIGGILINSINGYCSQGGGLIIECGLVNGIPPSTAYLMSDQEYNQDIIVGAIPEEYKIFEGDIIGKLYAVPNEANKFIFQDEDDEYEYEVEVLPICEDYFKIGNDGNGELNKDAIYQSTEEEVAYARYQDGKYYLLNERGNIPYGNNKREVIVLDLRDNDKYFFSENNIFENTYSKLSDLQPAVLDLNGNKLTVNSKIVNDQQVPTTVTFTQFSNTGENPGTIDLVNNNNKLVIEPGSNIGNGAENPITIDNGVLDLCQFFDEEGKLIEGNKITLNFGENKPVIKLFNEDANTLKQLEQVMKNYSGGTLFPNIDFDGATPAFDSLSSGNNILDYKIIQQLFNLSDEALEAIHQHTINADITNGDGTFNIIDHINIDNEFSLSDVLDSILNNGVLVANGNEDTSVFITKADCQKINAKYKTFADVFEDGFKGTVTVTDAVTAECTAEDPEVQINVGGISLNLAFLKGGKISELITSDEPPAEVKQTMLDMKGNTLKTDKLKIPAKTRLKLKGGTLVI